MSTLFNLNERNIDYFQGIVFPFFSVCQEDQVNSNLIVHIIEHEYHCYTTKARVPYKIIVETVDLNDFKKYQKQKMSQ